MLFSEEVTGDVDRRVLECCDLHSRVSGLMQFDIEEHGTLQRSTAQSSTACKRQHSAAQRAQHSTAQGGIAQHQSAPARLSRQAHRKVGDHCPDEGDKQRVWDAL